jgi:hypothetical protein
MRRIIIALFACLLLAGCSTASAKDATEAQQAQTFRAVATDKPIPQVVINHSENAPEAEPENAPESEPEPTSDEETDEQVYEPEPEYTEDYSGSGTYYAEYSDLYNTDGPSHEMPGWYEGYLETYYSSNVMRHYMTDEWTADDEGFYRDSEGRYVIGVDADEGIEIGTVVQTGKGEAVVMDYGSGAHVHDFYTNW